MIKAIKNWILDKYLNFLFWYDRKKLEKSIEEECKVYFEPNNMHYYQNDVERKYAEGLALVKNKINTAANSENYEKVLEELKELVHLGREETENQKLIRKTLEKIYVRKGKDVKNSRDKKQMINERIDHYTELRDHKEKRNMLREIRTLRKEGKHEEAELLEKEWKNKYGN